MKQTVDRRVEHERLLKAAGDPEKLAPMTPHFFGAVVIDQPGKCMAVLWRMRLSTGSNDLRPRSFSSLPPCEHVRRQNNLCMRRVCRAYGCMGGKRAGLAEHSALRLNARLVHDYLDGLMRTASKPKCDTCRPLDREWPALTRSNGAKRVA